MLSFKELKVLIAKSCRVVSKSDDLTDRFSFDIDFTKLEKKLQGADQNLHVLAFYDKNSSYVPYMSDVQLLTEYLHTPEELNMVFNGQSEICTFMIFSTLTEKGIITLADDKGNPLSSEEIFNICNGEAEEINFETVKDIISTLPMYQVLVVRIFYKKQEKFEYKIFFRSNYEMVSLFKSTKNAKVEEENTSNEEVESETTEEKENE